MAQDANGDGDGGAAALPAAADPGAAAQADPLTLDDPAAAGPSAAAKATADKDAAAKELADKAQAAKAQPAKEDAQKEPDEQSKPEPKTPTGQGEAGQAAAPPAVPPAREADGFHHPELALAVGAAFLVATVAKMQLFKGDPDMVETVDTLASGALLVLTALWFLHCFTGDAKRRINDIFVFAYAFTLGSFALLVLPFVSEQQAQVEPDNKPRPASLTLLRGCVRKDAAGGLGEVSAVVLCPYENDKSKGWPDKPKYSPDSASTPRTMVAHTGELRYTLLLAIGGVTATVPDDQTVENPAPAVPAKPAPAPAQLGASAVGVEAPTKEKPTAPKHVEVMGGLAVPFFVLVLAFVGGAVSLSRRIPEYQRRLHPDYKPEPTDKEGKMREFEAREYVVFQVMQLVSAPFLAVATWYIVTPSGLSTAATLAFGTGFASEPLLLMIRGLVEGIKPEASRPKPQDQDKDKDKDKDKPLGE